MVEIIVLPITNSTSTVRTPRRRIGLSFQSVGQDTVWIVEEERGSFTLRNKDRCHRVALRAYTKRRFFSYHDSLPFLIALLSRRTMRAIYVDERMSEPENESTACIYTYTSVCRAGSRDGDDCEK